MSFFFFMASVFFTGSTLAWLFLTTGFIKYRRREWLVLWLLVTVIAILFYRWGRSGEMLFPFLRSLIVSLSMFWIVLQGALLAAFPAWLGIAFFRLLGKWRGFEWEKNFQKIGMGVLILAIGIAGKAAWFPMTWELTPIEIHSENVPAGLDGMKIAQLTDVHVSLPEHVERLKEQLGGAVEAKADILIFTGDFVDDLDHLPAAIQAFKDVEAEFPLGVWFILGNHEYGRGLNSFTAAYEEADFPLLINEGVTLEYKGTPFYLAGVDYPYPESRRSGMGGGSASLSVAERDLVTALQDRPMGQTTILAAHHPIIFDKAFEEEILLSFAGHTHGYQAGIAGKSLLSPFVKYAWGLYGDENAYGYVSGGAGEWFPVRVGVPREVVIFTLRQKK